MTPRISFAISTKNEGQSIQNLLDQLVPHCKATGDEIVLVDDYSTDELTGSVLGEAIRKGITVRFHALQKDFARHKNFLNSLCKGDYIFQVDADELLPELLLENIHEVLDANQHVDLFYIARVNIVNGLTDNDIRKWGWKVNEKGHVMFPDYQSRLFRNSSSIQWEGKVHERIVGYKTVAQLPANEDWAIIHIKDIDRQRQQNEFYSTI